MPTPKILFLVKQNQGKSLWVDTADKKPGLSNSIETLIYGLRKYGLSVDIAYIPDRNFIHNVVNERKPDVVVIEAYWVNPAKLALLKALHPKIHWMVRNHSEVPFLAQEGTSGAWNCEYLKLGVELTCVSTRTVDDLMPLVKNLDVNPQLLSYLPNVYLNTEEPDVATKTILDNEVHIGCFGAMRPMKNHMEQALAAIDYANKTNKHLFFHINGTRIEGNGGQALKNLQGMFQRLHNCDLVEHAWMDKQAFYKLLSTKIDVLLQCSLTESFNIVAADAVYCAVPVVASPEIRWLGARFHCNPTSVVSISNLITNVFRNGQHGVRNYVDAQIAHLETYNTQAIATWVRRFG